MLSQLLGPSTMAVYQQRTLRDPSYRDRDPQLGQIILIPIQTEEAQLQVVSLEDQRTEAVELKVL